MSKGIGSWQIPEPPKQAPEPEVLQRDLIVPKVFVVQAGDVKISGEVKSDGVTVSVNVDGQELTKVRRVVLSIAVDEHPSVLIERYV